MSSFSSLKDKEAWDARAVTDRAKGGAYSNEPNNSMTYNCTRRGGFLASTLEHFLKLDMLKWLRILRDFHLFPRVFGQDVSKFFLQRFDGTVTIIVGSSDLLLSSLWLIVSESPGSTSKTLFTLSAILPWRD
jgi:hypothetical protein